MDSRKCYNCGKVGHLSRECTEPRDPNPRPGPRQQGRDQQMPSDPGGSNQAGRGRGRGGGGGGRGGGRGGGSFSYNQNRQPQPTANQARRPPTEDQLAAIKRKKKERADRRKLELERWAQAELEFPTFQAGVGGNDRDIKSNFFKIAFLEDLPTLHRYSIELDQVKGEEPSNRNLRIFLIQGMFAKKKPTSTWWVTDWVSNVVSVGRLYNDEKDSISTIDHERSAPGGSTNIQMKSKIIFKDFVNISELKKLVQRGVSTKRGYHPGQDLTAMNLIFWYDILMSGTWKGTRIGKKFYPDITNLSKAIDRVKFIPQPQANRQMKEERNQVYVAKGGFFCSTRPGDSSLLLNVNTTTSAFFPTWNLQRWIEARFMGPRIWAGYSSEVKGLKVTFEGDPVPKRIYKIASVSSLNVSQQKINDHGPESVYNAFRNRFRQTPWKPDTKYFHKNSGEFNKNACCINLGTESRPDWYPADKLLIEDWQAVRNKLESDLQSEMIKLAEKTPKDNQADVLNYALESLGIITRQNLRQNKLFLKSFGISVIPDFIQISSRYLSQPNLQFSECLLELTKECATSHNKATWDLTPVSTTEKSGLMTIGNKLPQLCLIYVSKKSENHPTKVADVETFCANLTRSMLQYGFETKGSKFSEAQYPQLHEKREKSEGRRDQRKEFCANLKKAWENLSKPRFVLILLPGNDATVFADVKWWADCYQGVASVCVTPKAINRDVKRRSQDQKVVIGDKAMHGNISLKINFKLEGINHCLENTACYGAFEETMIVGADVTHAGQDFTTPSLAGVVATVDDASGRYLASARLQSNNTEFIEDLRGMMKERVIAYWMNSKARRLPKHILFYRDGVSESQYGMVWLDERPQIEKGCKDAAEELAKQFGTDRRWTPKLTLLVVGKRDHARFFPIPTQEENAVHRQECTEIERYNADARNRYKKKFKPQPAAVNLCAGLIIDHTVVESNRFNFYLQSHDSPLGTAKSGHYVVLHNGSGYTPAKLQETTYKICFTGSRATKALSVCTPARYADILCDRLRCYMRPAFENEIVYPEVEGTDPVPQYRRDPTMWNPVPNDSKRKNPWHPDLDSTMFYL